MQTMRDLLKSSLGRSLETLPPLDRLQAAWTLACGKAMAAHGRITAYEQQAVTIEVDSTTWQEQMFSMRPMLTRELARIAGVPVVAIHFLQRK